MFLKLLEWTSRVRVESAAVKFFYTRNITHRQNLGGRLESLKRSYYLNQSSEAQLKLCIAVQTQDFRVRQIEVFWRKIEVPLRQFLPSYKHTVPTLVEYAIWPAIQNFHHACDDFWQVVLLIPGGGARQGRLVSDFAYLLQFRLLKDFTTKPSTPTQNVQPIKIKSS